MSSASRRGARSRSGLVVKVTDLAGECVRTLRACSADTELADPRCQYLHHSKIVTEETFGELSGGTGKLLLSVVVRRLSATLQETLHHFAEGMKVLMDSTLESEDLGARSDEDILCANERFVKVKLIGVDGFFDSTALHCLIDEPGEEGNVRKVIRYFHSLGLGIKDALMEVDGAWLGVTERVQEVGDFLKQ